MAKVDFGSFRRLPRKARANIEEQAAKLPLTWSVRLALKSDSSRPITVLVEGDRADYRARFDQGRFDLVASFLRTLANNIGPRPG
jgi:hypothetical protein